MKKDEVTTKKAREVFAAEALFPDSVEISKEVITLIQEKMKARDLEEDALSSAFMVGQVIVNLLVGLYKGLEGTIGKENATGAIEVMLNELFPKIGAPLTCEHTDTDIN